MKASFAYILFSVQVDTPSAASEHQENRQYWRSSRRVHIIPGLDRRTQHRVSRRRASMTRLLRRASVGFSGFRNVHSLRHRDQSIGATAVDDGQPSRHRRSVGGSIHRLSGRMTRQRLTLGAGVNSQVVQDDPPNNSRIASIDDFIIRTSSRLSWQPPSTRADSDRYEASAFQLSRRSRPIRSRRLLRDRSTTSLSYPRLSAYESWTVDGETPLQNTRSSEYTQQSTVGSDHLLQRLRRRFSRRRRASDSTHERQQRFEPAASPQPHEAAIGSLRRAASRLQRRSTTQEGVNSENADGNFTTVSSDVHRQVSRRSRSRLRRLGAKQLRRKKRQDKQEQRKETRRQQTACGLTGHSAHQLTQETRANIDGAPAAGIDAEYTAPGQSGKIKGSTTRSFPEADHGPSTVVQRHHRRSSSSVSFDSPIYNDSFV